MLWAILLITAFISIGSAENWDDLKAASDKVTSVSADFTQEKHMKILSRPLIAEGVFYFQAPSSLRLEYQRPVRSVLLLHKGKTKRFIQKDGDFIEDASANLQFMQRVLQEITHWLKGRFDENPDFSATLEPGWKIVLVPKSESLAISILIYEGEDSYTKLDFKNVVLNQPLEDSLFRKIG
jgi:outer membrane lipoprotein-sorting protein